MRILIGADTYYPGVDGASYFTQRLATGLKARGHQVLVIAPSRSLKSEYFSHDGVEIFGVSSWPTVLHKFYRFTPPLFIKNKIRPVIKRFQPEVAHIQGHFFIERAVVRVAGEQGVPTMGTNHFMPENLLHYLHAPKPIENLIKKFGWWQFKILFEKLPIVTTPTHTAAELLQQIGLAHSVLAVSCGIDLQKFKPENKNPELLKKYSLPTDRPIFLCVGRLAPEKNVDLILRALSPALKNNSAHLAVAGNGMEKSRLERLAGELGIKNAVTFLGFVPDVDLPGLYPLAQVFIMAGTAELQSLVIMEAMASGLPVIAVRALALPELAHPGVNGFLFNPGDEKALREAAEQLIANPQERLLMGAKSRELILKHDINLTMERYEELYRQLVEKYKKC